MQGTSVGPYRIESELGSGGMGTVWLATKGDERVALKIVHPHLLATPGFFKRTTSTTVRTSTRSASFSTNSRRRTIPTRPTTSAR